MEIYKSKPIVEMPNGAQVPNRCPASPLQRQSASPWTVTTGDEQRFVNRAHLLVDHRRSWYQGDRGYRLAKIHQLRFDMLTAL